MKPNNNNSDIDLLVILSFFMSFNVFYLQYERNHLIRYFHVSKYYNNHSKQSS